MRHVGFIERLNITVREDAPIADALLQHT